MNVEPSFLERIAAGDPLAVEGCLERYRGLVWSMTRRFAGNHADAEDAVQEVFIELWRHAGRFDPTMAEESTFVATIARRRLIDRHRRRARRPEAVSLVAEPATTARSETDRLETLEEGRHARELLEQLRPQQRQVLELSFDQGMSQQEIADATKLPLGTVKTHARRGLMRLRQLLETSPDGAARGEPLALPEDDRQP
ncbi:MAG: sigma-70 family RNA polymerase sigma factor [Rhodopirellula sp.]|nr:sigma-70 family RNA polymerase sigma factor [Rhodopirellula sp.]